MKTVFGPVNSRRFGLSLGIDLSPESKSCNFDCLYCELEAAKPIDHIDNPPTVEQVIADVKSALVKTPNIDVITITSNGEPTLYPHLDELVRRLNELKGKSKLLILSNASTIMDKHIQDSLLDIDIVKLSLDCATPKCFQKIDRPLKSIHIDDIIEGMLLFRKRFNHALVVEVLVVEGINDNEEEMDAIAKVLKRIKPNRIDLGTIDRPPAYKVRGVDTQTLVKLSESFVSQPLSIIHKDSPKERVDFDDEAILALLKRRPQSQYDVAYLFTDRAEQRLQKLIEEKRVHIQSIAGVRFYDVRHDT